MKKHLKYSYLSGIICILFLFACEGEKSELTVIADPPAEDGPFTAEVEVTLTASIDSATIYYTVDGTDPSSSSEIYEEAIVLKENTSLKFFALGQVKEETMGGMSEENKEIESAVYSEEYVLGTLATQGTSTITIPSSSASNTSNDNSNDNNNSNSNDNTAESIEIEEDNTPPSASMAAASQSVAENVGSVSFTVNLDKKASSAVSIPYTLSGTTGDGEHDLQAGSLTIASGAKTITKSFSLVDDTLYEGNETLIITLGEPTGATLSANKVHTITIEDNETLPTASFSAASQSVAEDDGTATVSVNLSHASTNTASIPYTVGGTAAVSDDHDLAAGTLSIAAGSTSGTISFSLEDNSVYEVSETVILTFGSLTGATTGTHSTHTVTITDDDSAPNVQFNTGDTAVEEDEGSYNIYVKLSTASEATTTVEYTVGGTATAGGTDHNLSAGTVTFVPGDTLEYISMTFTDDNDSESDETLVLTLQNPDNATLGSTSSKTIAIWDNEKVLYATSGDSTWGFMYGHAVASAGDYNNDGTPDYVVGDYCWGGNPWCYGKVYIYSGSNGAELHSIEGTGSYQYVGVSVDGVGDYNGDGYDDIIYGGYNLSSKGQAFIISGNDDSILWTGTGENSSDNYGFVVKRIGDFDNNGTRDFAVSAPRFDGTSKTDNGKVYVYSGSNGSLLSSFEGEASEDQFGYALGSKGEVNGDTKDDLLVCTYQNDGAGSNYGEIYVYSGEDDSLLWSKEGDSASFFGFTCDFVTDQNSDSRSDVIVGAFQHVGGGGASSQRGKVFVYSGANGSELYTINGETDYDNFGYSVSGIGDFNNDGTNDIAVGAKNADGLENVYAGKVYIYSGTDHSLLHSRIGAGSGSFGSNIQNAGDMNGDNYDDIIIGDFDNGKGRMWIYKGFAP